MSDKSIIGLSRLVTLRQQVDTVARNIANQSTTGYKREGLRFREYLTEAKEEDVRSSPLRSLVARGFGWGVLVQHPQGDASYEGLPLRRVQIADHVQPAPVVIATIASATLSRRTLACIDVIRSLRLAE